MTDFKVLLAGLFVSCILFVGGGNASENDLAEVSLPLTIGIQSQEHEVEGMGNVLIPLWRGPRSVLLTNIRKAANDQDEEELNFGFGVRHLVETHFPFILGGFIFYDGRWTKHNNRFDQLGLSAEFFSGLVDGRFNYYLPNHDTMLVDRQEVDEITERRHITDKSETVWGDPYGRAHSILQDWSTTWTRQETLIRDTTTHLYENREAALEGWDTEIGVRLPFCEQLFETRIFGGYQYFNHPFSGHLKGAHSRIELRAWEGRLLLDAQVFENRELNQSDWRAGIRIRLPFDLSELAQKRNPFAWKSSSERADLRRRFDEMPMRDPKIQIQKSGYVEDVSKRLAEKKSETKTKQYTEGGTEVIAEGITFVNADTGRDSNPGTMEAPKKTIQAGVNVAQPSRLHTMEWPDAQQRSIVYVQAASAPYDDNTVISQPNIGLIGGGLAGYGGKVFENGARSKLVSDGTPSVTVLNTAGGAGIAGFEFTGTAPLATGLRSESGRVLVWDNEFTGLSRGVDINTLDENVDSWILGNRFSDNGRAMGVLAQGTGIGDFELRVEDNFVMDGAQGAYVTAVGYGSAYALLAGNELRNLSESGLEVGIELAAVPTGPLNVDIRDNVAEQVGTDAGEHAIRVIGESGWGAYQLVGNRVEGADGGIRLDVAGDDLLWIWAEGNDVSYCAQTGISVTALTEYGYVSIGAEGNRIVGSGAHGLAVEAKFRLADIDMDVSRNVVQSSGDDGINIVVNSTTNHPAYGAWHTSLVLNENLVEDNQGDGININVASSNNVTVALNRNILDRNAGNGIRVHTENDNSPTTLSATSNQVYNSASAGIHLSAHSKWGEVLISAIGNTANDNGTGIFLDSRNNTYVPLVMVANDNTTLNNATNGLYARMYTANSTNSWITMMNNVSSENGEVGINVQVDSAWGLRWLATGNTITDNDVGVKFKWTWSPTMGILTFNENSNYSNRTANLSYEGILNMNAQSNWWGACPPDMNMIIRKDTGKIDVNNSLTEAP